MAISSTSTLADCKGQYLDNVGYRTDGSVATAKAFLEACRALLMKLPSESQQGEHRIRREMSNIRDEIKAAESWITANDTVANGGGGVKFRRFDSFRT